MHSFFTILIAFTLRPQSYIIHDSDLVDSDGSSWHAKLDALLAMKPCQLKFHQPLKPDSVLRYARQMVVRQNFDQLLDLPHSNPGQLAKLARNASNRAGTSAGPL